MRAIESSLSKFKNSYQSYPDRVQISVTSGPEQTGNSILPAGVDIGSPFQQCL